MLLKEVMEMTGLSRKAIQYYEDQGFIKPSKRKNGYREYDDVCIDMLKQIQQYRRLGLHMMDIRAILLEGEYAPQIYEETVHDIDRTIVELQERKTGAA